MATDLKAQHYNTLFKTGAFGVGRPMQGVSDTTYMSPEEGAAATRALQDDLTSRRTTDAQRAIAWNQQAGENQRAQLSANAAMLPHQLKQDRFNQLMPYLGGLFGGAGGGGPMGSPGGYTSAPPTIKTYNPWSRGLTQQNVNAARASNDKALGGQLRSMRESLGARNQGANTALSTALGNQLRMGSLANSQAQARGVRNEFGQRGADQDFRVNQLQNQQWGMLEDADIRRRTPALGAFSQIFSSLLG